MVTTIENGRIIKSVIEEINMIMVLTERVKIRKEEYMMAKEHICAERSRLATESWKETEGEPMVIRRAKLFRKILQGISVTIRNGELVVGSLTKYIRGASPCIDFSTETVFDILNADIPKTMDEVTEAILSEEDRKKFMEDAQYWKGRSPGEVWKKEVHEIVGEQIDDYLESRLVAWRFEFSSTSRTIDYEKAINLGLNGVLTEIREELKNLDLSIRGNWQKLQFYRAGIICCEAVIEFAKRYAKLAREMAEKERNKARKEELEQIANNCEWVPANPARNFHEALQSFWFTHLAFYLESAAVGETPGRMDQYLYPLYQKDISEGGITRQQAGELLSCLWVKFNEILDVKGIKYSQMHQASQFQDVTIGGITQDGRDATNELSYMLLEVTRQLKMAQPPLYIRCHKDISEDFLIKAAETNRDNGAGNPAFLNDEPMIIKMMERGVPLNEARNWMAVGCVGGCIPNAYLPSIVGVMFNKVKAFELALYNGKDPRTGKQLGPATGDPRDFKSYNELYNAFIVQIKHQVDIALRIYRAGEQARGELYCHPFNSVLTNDCIKKGMIYDEGGSRYPQVSPTFAESGHQNISDSLAAIKKLVFDDKKITMGEILDAIAVNFEGKEKIHKMLLTAPKYGNDDDYADDIFNDVSLDTSRIMSEPRDIAGYPISVGRGGGSGHYWAGLTVGALPDGRKAYEATADAALSPVQGMDTKGPTAVILSASKVNQMEYTIGTVFNMKIMPSLLQTKEGIRKFLSLIKTYFDRGGWHLQFNMIDRAVLLEAQKHPEKYRDLLVRVAGYSAYYVELSPKVQDEIIARTEHSF